MRIQLGTIYINKTKKYLLPCLQEYGKEFTENVVKLFKLAIGIGDFLIEDTMKLDKHIFILVDTRLSRRHFKKTLEWLKTQDYYGFDYPYDDMHIGHLHMIAIKLPEKFYQSFGNFKEGKFSKMYQSSDIEKLFKQEKEETKVLKRDKDYKIIFVNKVNQIFNTTVRAEEWTGELDFPIIPEEEIFNKEKQDE